MKINQDRTDHWRTRRIIWFAFRPLVLGALALGALCLAGSAQAANNYWTGGAGTGDWHTLAKWSLGRVPNSADNGRITNTATVTISSAAENPSAIYVTGWQTGTPSTPVTNRLNIQTNVTATVCLVGRYTASYSTVVQTAGNVSWNRASGTPGLGISYETGSNAVYEISGGSMSIPASDMELGSTTVASAPARFRVVGSGATSIGVWGPYLQSAGGTYEVQIDAGGLTALGVTNAATFASGATLVADFKAGTSPYLSTWTVMRVMGALTDNGLTLSAGANWSMAWATNGGTKTLTVAYTPPGAPSFTSHPVVKPNAEQGQPYTGQTLTNNVADPDTALTNLRFSKVSGPAWLTVATNGALSGTPGAGDVGTKLWTVSVTDGLYTNQATLQVTVQDPSGLLDNLVFAYDFESINGSTVPDISGNGNNGTMHNLTPDSTNPKSGSTQHVKTPTDPTTLLANVVTPITLSGSYSQLSFSMWYNDQGSPGRGATGNARLLTSLPGTSSRLSAGQRDFDFITRSNSPTTRVLYFEDIQSGSALASVTSTAITPNMDSTWHQAGFVFTNGVITFYFDGAPLGSPVSLLRSGSPVTALGGNPWPLSIIEDPTNNPTADFDTEYFHGGDYDEARLWTKALTADQMRALFTAALPPPTGTILRIAYNPGVNDLTFAWNATNGIFYDLLSNTGLVTAPAAWAVYQTYENIPADPSGTNILEVPMPPDARRFFALAQRQVLPARDKFLVLDARLIDQLQNAALRLGTVAKYPGNPLFGEDKPWEMRFDNLYANILYDTAGSLYKCWYSPFIIDYSALGMTCQQMLTTSYSDPANRQMGVCYAVSSDGLSWTKPNLGLVTYGGSTTNNLLLAGPHGAGVFKDTHDPDPQRLYKMFHATDVLRFSADGLHWGDPVPCPGVNSAGDTHNNLLWAPELGRYAGFVRLRDNDQRIVGRTESADLTQWTTAIEVLRNNAQDQAYSMPVFRYADIYLGLVAIFRTAEDRVHTELAWSPDTKTWNRIQPGTPFIGNSTNACDYDWGCVYAADAPVVLDDPIRLYYGGSNGKHTGWRCGFLCLATLRPDGWAGYEPADPGQSATVLTKPILPNGATLRLTADVAPGGSIRAAVEGDAANTLAACVPLTTNVTDAPVTWQAGKPIGASPVALRFQLTNAKLYSFRFAN